MRNPSEYTLLEIESLIRVDEDRAIGNDAAEHLLRLTQYIQRMQALQANYQVQKEVAEIKAPKEVPRKVAGKIAASFDQKELDSCVVESA